MPWNSSNPLYRWKMKHGGVGKHRKANKSKAVHMSSVRPMARRKRYGRIRRAFRQRHPKRFSLLTGVGLLAGVTSSINPSRTSIFESVQHGIKGEWSWDTVTSDIVAQTIGYDMGDHKWRLPTLPTMLLVGCLASKAAGYIVKPSVFDAIPIIGKKIKL